MKLHQSWHCPVLGNEILILTQNLKALQVPVTDYRLFGHFADPT